MSTSSASGSSEDTLKVTGILFPYNEDNPRLVEVDYKVTQDDDDPVSWDNLNLDPWLKGFRRCHEITHMEEDGPPLGRTLQMWYNDDFIRDSSPLNRCIARLVPDNGHPWGDNILVTRVKQPSMTYPEVRNATLDDIEPTLAHIRAYGQRVVS